MKSRQRRRQKPRLRQKPRPRLSPRTHKWVEFGPCLLEGLKILKHKLTKKDIVHSSGSFSTFFFKQKIISNFFLHCLSKTVGEIPHRENIQDKKTPPNKSSMSWGWRDTSWRRCCLKKNHFQSDQPQEFLKTEFTILSTWKWRVGSSNPFLLGPRNPPFSLLSFRPFKRIRRRSSLRGISRHNEMVSEAN